MVRVKGPLRARVELESPSASKSMYRRASRAIMISFNGLRLEIRSFSLRTIFGVISSANSPQTH